MFICILVSCAAPLSAQPSKNTVAGAVSINANSVTVASEWPDSPNPVWQQQTSSSDGETTPQIDAGEGKQTKRILGVIPNFRSASVNSHLPAQTPKEKFTGFAEDSFDYSSFIFIGLLSGVSQFQG